MLVDNLGNGLAQGVVPVRGSLVDLLDSFDDIGMVPARQGIDLEL